VNKLNKKVILKNSLTFFILLLFGSIFHVNAQETTPYERGSQYILGGVEVTGKLTFNQQTVVTFAGLEKGQKIIVPSLIHCLLLLLILFQSTLLFFQLLLLLFLL